MDTLLKELGQVAVFLICARTLLHFRAKDSYEKYIKLLIGMMLLVLLAEPFLNLAGVKGEATFTDLWKEYEEKINEAMQSESGKEEQIEELLQNMARESVSKGVEYAKQQEEAQAEEASVSPVQVEIKVEKIEIGEDHGDLAENS